MFTIYREELDWAGRKLILETGRVARQADGAVLATYGETTVLATVVSAKEPKPGIDFFPLTVNYQEKAFAAGRIPGGYFKREGRPSERETLISRLIDRPIRPLFVDGYSNDTQVIVTVLSHDLDNDPDVLAMVAASAALTLSGVPFMGPVGGASVGYINGELKLNPTLDEMKESIARPRRRRHRRRRADGRVGGQGALRADHARGRHARPSRLPAGDRGDHPPGREGRQGAARLPAAGSLGARGGHARRRRGATCAPPTRSPPSRSATTRVDAAKAKVTAHFLPEGAEAPAYTKQQIGEVFKDLQAKVVRWNILDNGIRIDGRDVKTVRPIVCEAGFLPRTHGSALFTRGETQALAVATLGTGDDEQYVDSLEGTYKERFLLHYNFPPYSVGETGRMGSPGRREIGHGKLAWRAIRPMLPPAARVPLHHPRRLRDHRVRTARPRWRRCAAPRSP